MYIGKSQKETANIVWQCSSLGHTVLTQIKLLQVSENGPRSQSYDLELQRQRCKKFQRN
jgi:hypothetical protein